jgi:hypothetical protein
MPAASSEEGSVPPRWNSGVMSTSAMTKFLRRRAAKHRVLEQMLTSDRTLYRDAPLAVEDVKSRPVIA